MTSFIKHNFDGVSKGNPDHVGFGVVFRDDQRIILLILDGNFGNEINNVV